MIINNNILIYFYCVAVLGISSVACSSEKNQTEENDTKNKRQIGVHQTAISPHHSQVNHVDTIYGSHPNQFVIQTVEQPLHALQQRQSHNIVQQPEQNSEISHHAFSQKSQPVQEEKYPNKASRKYIIRKPPLPLIPEHLQQQQQDQYVQPQQQLVQQFHILSPQDLKFFQDEIAARASSLANSNLKRPQINSFIQENGAKQGLGNYREPSVYPENQESVPSYTQEKLTQPYYAQVPIDYHRSIPNHPLASSSLEKELEKLVASNKANQQVSQKSQPQIYKASKQQKQVSTTFPVSATTVPISASSSPEKFLSFFPDIAQLSGFKPNGDTYFNEQPKELATKTYPAENFEREPKSRKANSGNNQYLIEKPKFKTHQPQVVFQQQQKQQVQLQHSQQKEQLNYVQAQQNNRNSVMKIIEPPSLNYEKPQIITYYRGENPEKADTAIPLQQKFSAVQPSTSTIFVSQGTGIHSPNLQSPVSTKTHNEEKHTKLPQLPPLDGKPLTQEEFQALVDAGYPVQAVPVPVPVPYEQFVRQLPQQHYAPEDYVKIQKKPNRHSPKQAAAYHHRINAQHYQQTQQLEHERNYPERT